MERLQTRLHAAIAGDPAAAAPAVFLHGFGGEAADWDSVRKAIGGADGSDCPTIAYDLPGHGGSLTAEGLGGAGRMAKAVLADIEARGLSRIHLVGHSMGGAVAALVALRAPQAVGSLTLLAPGGFGPEINHRLLQRYAAATDRDTLALALEHMFGWNRAVPAALIDRRLAARSRPVAVEALEAILPSMLSGERGEQGMIPRDGLASLTMPVKVLWGTQDRVLPTRQAHKLPPLFAAHVFEDTGHMLVEEQEEAVIALVRQNIRTGS